MKFYKDTADIFIPDNTAAQTALAKTTHLGVGAHQDDLEFMTIHGILECFGSSEKHFTGVTCSDGAGSSRAGIYEKYTNDEMKAVRRKEQRTAAIIGDYAAMIQLDFASSEIKARPNTSVVEDLYQIFAAAEPEFVYTHNPADKHDTHVGVVRAVIAALKRLPADKRPKAVYGCEIWRDLDWMPDKRKIVLNVSERVNIAAALSGVFDSQITGGKRYDEAVMGRRRAHATFFESHAVDNAEMLTFAMDLTPLIADNAPAMEDYTAMLIEEFKAEVLAKI